MPPNDKAGRVVFVGNIPYGGDENMILETLGRVGQVNNFRLVFDKETGRPKGFGFAEFADGDAAASAVRNLNDHEVMGRKLRVDWSNDNGSGDAAPAHYSAPAPMNGQPEPAPAQPSSLLPPLPPGVDVPPTINAPDAISRTLSTLPPPQLLDILSQMKGLVMTDPAKATELLRQAPQLAYAVFQSLLMLNLVDGTAVSSIVEPGSGPPPATAPTPTPQPQQPVSQAPQPFQGYPPQPVPTPPVQTQPQPQMYAQQPQQHSQTQLSPEQYAMVMQLTTEQIASLPPDAQAHIIQLRQQALGMR